MFFAGGLTLKNIYAFWNLDQNVLEILRGLNKHYINAFWTKKAHEGKNLNRKVNVSTNTNQKFSWGRHRGWKNSNKQTNKQTKRPKMKDFDHYSFWLGGKWAEPLTGENAPCLPLVYILKKNKKHIDSGRCYVEFLLTIKWWVGGTHPIIIS